MIVLLLQSSVALTQVDSIRTSSAPAAWAGPDGSICMTQERAALLLNAEDSLNQLYIMNSLIEDALIDCRTLTQISEESINNLIEQKLTLQAKIKLLEERLHLKNDKIMLYLEEVDECNIALTNANKKLKRQKTATTITSVVGASALVAIIVTVLTIVL